MIAIDIRSPKCTDWKTIVPQAEDTMTGAYAIDNKFLAEYLTDARTQVRVYDLQGKFLRNIDLPGIGTCSWF